MSHTRYPQFCAEPGDPTATGSGEPKSPGDEVPPGTPQTGEDVCPRCGGSGKLDGGECPDCEGSGTVIVNVGDA
jgi:DnaJ-class molecular chaperone